jgi:hypothetical protein
MHFSDNKNEPDKTAENYDRLWEMRLIFDRISDACAKYYSSPEQLVVGEIVMLFERQVIFKQCTRETQKVWDKNVQAV